MKDKEYIKVLTSYDFKDTISVPDGYDLKIIPDITRDNFQILIDEHNKMAEFVNSLVKHI
jgi:hypothetical protein